MFSVSGFRPMDISQCAAEGAGEEHILGAGEDGGLFGVEIPFAAGVIDVFAAHEDHGGMEKGEWRMDKGNGCRMRNAEPGT